MWLGQVDQVAVVLLHNEQHADPTQQWQQPALYHPAALTMLASSRADCMLMLGGCAMMAAAHGRQTGHSCQLRGTTQPGHTQPLCHKIMAPRLQQALCSTAPPCHSSARRCSPIPNLTHPRPNQPTRPTGPTPCPALTLGQVGLLSQPRPQQHLLLEVQVLLGEGLENEVVGGAVEG